MKACLLIHNSSESELLKQRVKRYIGEIMAHYVTVWVKCIINNPQGWEKWKEWDIEIFHWSWQIQKKNLCYVKRIRLHQTCCRSHQSLNTRIKIAFHKSSLPPALSSWCVAPAGLFYSTRHKWLLMDPCRDEFQRMEEHLAISHTKTGNALIYYILFLWYSISIFSVKLQMDIHLLIHLHINLLYNYNNNIIYIILSKCNHGHFIYKTESYISSDATDIKIYIKSR